MFRQSELLFRAPIENSYGVIMMLDAGGHVRYVSPGIRK